MRCVLQTPANTACRHRQSQLEAFQVKNPPPPPPAARNPVRGAASCMQVQRAMRTDRQQLCAEPAPRCEHAPGWDPGLPRNGAQSAPRRALKIGGSKQAPQDPPRSHASWARRGGGSPLRPAHACRSKTHLAPHPRIHTEAPLSHSRPAAAPASAASTPCGAAAHPQPTRSPGRSAASHHANGAAPQHPMATHAAPALARAAAPPAPTTNPCSAASAPSRGGLTGSARRLHGASRAGLPSPGGCQRAAEAGCPGAGAGCAGGRGRAGARSSAS